MVETGDVISVAGNTRFGKIIRWWTGEPVSHVGLACWVSFNGSKTIGILEALENTGEIGIHPLGRLLKLPGTIVYHQKNLLDGQSVLSHALEYWGDKYVRPYQFALMLSPFLRALRKVRGASIDLPGYHCAELVTRAFMSVGFTPPKDPVLVTPGDVTRFTCLGPMNRLEKT